ncbi:hypothetical protein OG800_50765 (plasmid) [Streptomyces sp. NBC_00445]|uniref:hypothetical protein n=1 Tax=Streptomyces sp. NBC_00445 TaxID=2975745 RepID=UPI002E2459E9
MPDAHPAHEGLPALYRAEVGVFHGRWVMSVIGPDLGMAAGPNLDLGPADILTTAHPDDPGRHMIAVVGEVPVLPREEAVRLLEEHGFVVEAAARNDARTDEGFTQVADAVWTVPCQPIAVPL